MKIESVGAEIPYHVGDEEHGGEGLDNQQGGKDLRPTAAPGDV